MTPVSSPVLLPRSSESPRPSRPLPPSPVGSAPLPAAVHDLLAAARRDLAEAIGSGSALDRYAAAHRCALRAAAAVLAVRTRPDRRRRPRSAWALLAGVAPELAEWAQFFAAGAGKRAAAEAGVRSAVTTREADDLLRDAQTFLGLVEARLGLHPAPSAAAPVGPAAALVTPTAPPSPSPVVLG